MGVVAVTSYDGHSLNDANYYAYMPESSFDPPDGSPIMADVNFSYQRLVGNKKLPKDQIVLIVELKAATTDTLFQARYHELNGWFNTQDGGLKYLVTTWNTAPTTRRIAVRPIKVQWEFKRCTVLLKAPDPRWENNTENQESWSITGSGQTKTIANAGNCNTQPIFRVQVTTAALNGWRWKHPIIIRNTTISRLLKYPLEITGSAAWDTAALIANVSKSCLVNGAINSSATTITVDTPGTAAFYSAGWIMIDTEQIYYSGKTSSSFTGCVRGVNGTTAASHADNAAVYQSEMAADGSDIAVEVDGYGEVPRWLSGINTTDTKVWANIPDLPAKPADEADGVFVTLGPNLANLYGTASVSSAKTDGGGAASLIAGDTASVAQRFWLASGLVPQYASIDLGSARSITAVRILQTPGDNGLKAFEIRASNDNWSSYVVIKTVTDAGKVAAWPPEWKTYTFDAASYRYWRIYITATYATGAPPKLHRFYLYNASANVWLKYGNPGAVRFDADAQKPMFNLSSSRNDLWVYSEFYDSNNPNRPAQWASAQVNGTLSQQRIYTLSHDASTVKDQYYESGNDASEVIYSPPTQAQTFTPSVSGELHSIELYLEPMPGHWSYVCDVYSVVSGVFTKIGEIGNVSLSGTGWAVFVRVPGQDAINLTSGVTYMMVPRTTGIGSGWTAYWDYDSTSATYSGGSRYYDPGTGVWTAAATHDFLFRVNIVQGRPNILGIATKNDDTIMFRNGWCLSQPCGVSQIVVTGATKQYPAYRKLLVMGDDSGGTRRTIYANANDTHSSWTSFGPLTYTVSPAAVNLIVVHWWLASSLVDNYAEVTDMQLTIASPPTVEFLTALATASLNFKLANTTTGQSIIVAGLIPLNTAVDIDCARHLVSEVVSGAQHAGWITADAVRDFWIDLQPGNNTLQLTDDGVVGLSIETRYRDRWI